MPTNSILPFVPVVLGDDGKPPKTIQVLPMGLWDAPFLSSFVKNEQDQLEITASDIDEIIQNFNNNARKGVPVDLEHSGGEAAGWIMALERVGNFLVATMEWTKLGVDKIKAKQFKFFSPEFSSNYIDELTGEKKGWVLIGGGLVNRPLFKELAPITAKERLTGNGGAMILLSQTQHMDKKLEAILAKDVADLTDEEKSLIVASEGELNDDQKKTYATILADDGDDSDTDTDDTDTDDTDDKDGDDSDDTDKDGDDTDDDTDKDDDTVKGREKMTAIKASDLTELRANAEQGVKAFEELRNIRAGEEAQQYIIGSENGRILEAGKEDLTTLILSFSEKQTELFESIMKNIPDAEMFKEVGNDESNLGGTSTQQFEAAIQKIMASDKIPYKEALNKAKTANPELYKAYDEEMESNK